MFCQDRVEQSISTLQKWTTDSTVCCGCRDLPQQADACQRMCIYQTDDKAEILGGAMQQLSQMRLNQPIMPAVQELHRQLAAELQVIIRDLPKVKPFRIQPFISTVHQHGAALMHGHTPDAHTMSDQVAGITMTHIQQFRKEHPNWRVVRIDKNTDCYVVMCWLLYMTIIIRAFHGSENYKKVYTYQTAQKAQDVLFIYYYVLTLVHPVLRTHIRRTAMRQQLSQAVPPLKSYQITREKLKALGLTLTEDLLLPVDFSTQEATDRWPATQRQLLQAAEAILDDASAQHGNLRVPRHIGSQLPWKVPGVRVSMKNSGLPLPDDEAKTREIFTQARHPHQPLLRKVGRAQQVLLRQYTEMFQTMQINTQAELINCFLKPAREYYRTQGITPAFIEFDLERMFPNIPRAKVNQAYENLHTRMTQMQKIVRGQQDTYVSIGKQKDKTMDCVGGRSRDHYNVFSVSDIRSLIEYDLHCNNLFVMGDEVWEQSTGVGIGGMLSAANADTVLTSTESDVRWGSLLPLRVKVGRFRDNIFVICPEEELAVWLPFLHSKLSELYNMPLKVESVGSTATFLECQLSVQGTEITWCMKNKVLQSKLTTSPPVSRYVHRSLPHARQVVTAMAQSLASKSVQIASTDICKMWNFSQAIWEMKYNEYPIAWWRPTLKARYSKENHAMGRSVRYHALAVPQPSRQGVCGTDMPAIAHAQSAV